ncbi:MAG TPA: hypothetical protein PK156_08715 [Polyangium sp.]|nr:hypothetical protein [Polyangium sp.]
MSDGVHWFRGTDAELVVAVWVTRPLPNQFHAGLYHRDYGDPRVLHFADDRDLCNDAPDELFIDGTHGLMALSLDDDDAQTLCALCRRVALMHAKDLRYRFNEWRPRFAVPTGELIAPTPDPQYGFTCATFVLAMLRSAVVEELLRLDDWPRPAPKDQDDRWQRKIAHVLCKRETAMEEIEKIIAGIGARRILPTDVAGGATHAREQWPVGYVDARREGEKIAGRI